MAQTREEKNAARRERRRIAMLNMTEEERIEMHSELIARRRQLHWGDLFDEWRNITASIRGKKVAPPSPIKDNTVLPWSEQWRKVTRELRERGRA